MQRLVITRAFIPRSLSHRAPRLLPARYALHNSSLRTPPPFLLHPPISPIPSLPTTAFDTQSPFTIPNFLTTSRLLCAPVISHFILNSCYPTAIATFIFASFTDFLDGHIARRFHLRSPLGLLLDPLADKALIAFTSFALYIDGILPLYLVSLIVSRDLVLVFGYLISPNQPVKVSAVSKLNTSLQFGLVATGMAVGAEIHGAQGLLAVLQPAVATTTVLSGGGYVMQRITSTT